MAQQPRCSTRININTIEDDWNIESHFNPGNEIGTVASRQMKEVAKNGVPFVEEVGAIIRNGKAEVQDQKVNRKGQPYHNGLYVKKQVAVDVVSNIRSEFVSLQNASVCRFEKFLNINGLAEFPLHGEPSYLQKALSQGQYDALTSIGGFAKGMKGALIEFDEDVEELPIRDGLLPYIDFAGVIDQTYYHWGDLRGQWYMENKGF